MKNLYIIIGFGILFFLNYASKILVALFKINFPAPLLGMLILVILIKSKLIPLHYIEDSCKILLNNMSLFFIPLLVGIVLYLHLIEKNAIPILLTVIISSVMVICATGATVELLINRRNKVK